MYIRILLKIFGPAGIWRCTHSTFSEFVVGQEYSCMPTRDGGHRIYHNFEKYRWAPYWEEERGKFCYAINELDFVFVRRFRIGEKSDRQRKAGATQPPDAMLDKRSFNLARNARNFLFCLERLQKTHGRDAAIFLSGALLTSLAFLVF